MVPLLSYIEACGNREAAFRFRGRDYLFSLSHGLFSSAGIDSGSRFLLKIFSNYLDNLAAVSAGRNKSDAAPFPTGEAPFTVLDAGCGAGVLGICAAGTLQDLASVNGPAGRTVLVRSQDRDELARVFTEYNARRNGLSEESLSVHSEPLLSGPGGWDLILCNIPAKAGLPVLEDFIRRSASVLKKDGRVFLVAVNTLADFFRFRIKSEASLLAEETGKEHSVFVYGANTAPEAAIGADHESGPLIFNEGFPRNHPFYIRNRNEYGMEDVSYRLDTVYGAPDFDSPGGAAQAAAKLAVKIKLAARLAADDTAGKALLIHDCGQGHFALWLVHYLAKARAVKAPAALPIVLSGRNILALASARAALSAARAALAASGSRPVTAPLIVPTADIYLDRERLGDGFGFIAYIPEIVPETNRGKTDWEALTQLAQPGSVVIAAMNSAEAERFDRKKTAAWRRLGDIKRNGFRALAYLRIE